MAYGMKAAVSRWEAGICRSRVLRDPDRAALEAALAELDGDVCTELSLDRWEEGGGCLTISGGPGVFLVTGERDDGALLQLCRAGERTANAAGYRARTGDRGARHPDEDPNHVPEESVWLVCGGQGAYFPADELVDAAAARWAVRQFLAGFPDGLGAPWRVE
ncbi:Imm1 family immunity protein [Streptomyces piniterrae]|uniref:Imm1 family immunity protein n=1 Tax=Streptomyces piniterrae TaxID=2571125 RepID=UPI00145D076A|nr:Imm1 family immunity protein [Streptomyces piniterrae]